MQRFADEGSTFAVFSRSDSRLPVSCQPAHPHFPRATRGALNALLRPAVPRSRCISPFEDRDLHPAERGVVKAAKDTQQDDHLQGLEAGASGLQ